MTSRSAPAELDAPATAASREARVLRWLWIAVGALLIAGVVSAFVVDEEPAPGVRLAAAAEAVDDAGPFAYELTLEAAGALGTTLGMTGTVDPENERSKASLQVGGATVETISDGDQLYVQVPEAAREGFGGRPWARIAVDAVATGFGGVSPAATPLETFEQLRKAGKVEEVGEEQVRGELTIHLRTVLDLRESVPDTPGTAEVRKALREVEVEVWLDADDRIRRHRTTIDLAGAAGGGGAAMGIVTTVETFDFGKATAIEIPPADQVADAGPDALAILLTPAPAPAD